MKTILTLAAILACSTAGIGLAVPARAQELKPIALPAPRLDAGQPLMKVLQERKSSREYATDPLPLQTLSELLWAANGINRPAEGKRTAPTAVNWQNVDVYVALKDGVYLYDAKASSLVPVVAGDLRAATGQQDFVKIVPVDLVYVADLAKIPRGTEQDKMVYSAAHAGFISQNVYLYCASEGLATVVRAMVDKEALAQAFKLRPDQKVVFAQSVGYPAKK